MLQLLYLIVPVVIWEALFFYFYEIKIFIINLIYSEHLENKKKKPVNPPPLTSDPATISIWMYFFLVFSPGICFTHG